MDKEINETLNKIHNDFNIEKFGLNENIRVFLDKLCLDNNYLKYFFEDETNE